MGHRVVTDMVRPRRELGTADLGVVDMKQQPQAKWIALTANEAAVGVGTYALFVQALHLRYAT